MVLDLARSTGLGPVASPPRGALGDHLVHSLPLPVNAPLQVVVDQHQQPRLLKDPGGGPLPEAPPDRRFEGTVVPRKRAPLAACVQHVEDTVENAAKGNRPAARRPPGFLGAKQRGAEAVQDRTKALLLRAEDAVVDLINVIDEAKRSSAPQHILRGPRRLHRQAQWWLDFVAAENSMGFHAPQEAARILAEAIDLARQGQVGVLKTVSGR